MRNLLVLAMFVAVGVVLAGCPEEKKDPASPASSGAAATASASASATPKAAGTGGGW